MSDNKALAQAAKARGNTAFTAGQFEKAVEEFSQAIELDASDHVFFSNRSGAYASLKQYGEALADAEKCIELNPSFVKGYSRKGAALYGMSQFREAKAAYEQGLAMDANNAQMKEGVAQCEQAMRGSGSANPMNPMAQLFGPQMFVKLAANPVTKQYLEDPSFVAKLQQLSSNPNSFGQLASDPRMQTALGVILGLPSDISSKVDEDLAKQKESSGESKGNTHIGDEDDDEEMPASKPAPSSPPKPQPQSTPKQPEPKPELTEEQKEEQKKKQMAEDEKKKGNALYLKRQFDEALKHYEQALTYDPNNVAIKTNQAAVYYEKKEFDKCIEICQKAIEVGREHQAPYEQIAKAYARIGNAYNAQQKYAEAIDAYERSLLEDNVDKTRDMLKKAQAAKKKADELAYLSPEKALEHKEKGNAFFREGKWVDAISEYSEAIRRDPSQAAYYSNRAACYQKLMDWQRGMDDCDTCLKLDPKFVKAYIRKGKIQHFLKQYHKAVDTYKEGLAIDPNNEELKDGLRTTQYAIAQENAAGQVDPRRAQEAMKDPEIQAIMKDPTVMNVLREANSGGMMPESALRDPSIMAKINKLVQAGILQIGGQ